MIKNTSDPSIKAQIKKLSTEGYYEDFPDEKYVGVDLDLLSHDESTESKE